MSFSSPESNLHLREQALNKLTLAAGSLMLSGAGVYLAFERPVEGAIIATTTGAFSGLLVRLGLAEFGQSRQP